MTGWKDREDRSITWSWYFFVLLKLVLVIKIQKCVLNDIVTGLKAIQIK